MFLWNDKAEVCMSLKESLMRAGVWCRRFRHRCGYGVHSPFAFDLITRVIYERLPYYGYEYLDQCCKNFTSSSGGSASRKVCRLLFRLANEMQPRQMLDLGTGNGLPALYLSMAVKKCPVLTLDEADCLADARMFSSCGNVVSRVGDMPHALLSCLPSFESLDFVHFNARRPERVLWEELLVKTHGRTLFVIEGICSSPAMKAWWTDVVADSRTGITFDLYDLGLVFFDLKKIKQHYVVNF